jgi:hypothetical protein
MHVYWASVNTNEGQDMTETKLVEQYYRLQELAADQYRHGRKDMARNTQARVEAIVQILGRRPKGVAVDALTLAATRAL